VLRERRHKVVAIDIEGQTLLINGVHYAVPGSVGIVGDGGRILLHEIIRWPRDLFENPTRRNILTGLSFEACKYGHTLAYVRQKVAEILFSADTIVMHGQVGDIKGLFFSEQDYLMLRNKIRDVGGYYRITTTPSSMALQLATFLLLQREIQVGYHYAIEDAFYTLMLYYADMDAFEQVHGKSQNSIDFEDGWPTVSYPPNEQMSGLWECYAERWKVWPKSIRRRAFRNRPPPGDVLNQVDPVFPLRSPYDVNIESFDKFFNNKLIPIIIIGGGYVGISILPSLWSQRHCQRRC